MMRVKHKPKFRIIFSTSRQNASSPTPALMWDPTYGYHKIINHIQTKSDHLPKSNHHFHESYRRHWWQHGGCHPSKIMQSRIRHSFFFTGSVSKKLRTVSSSILVPGSHIVRASHMYRRLQAIFSVHTTLRPTHRTWYIIHHVWCIIHDTWWGHHYALR